ncbi:hypothetical protein EVJ58_g521 [Rhodofomes roseus]|uniref:F-box domain-containing protein n=1 Tax=Rhodofomes roseus TaxID=34475 RepID=A0A4Y9Z5V6_9APHY|nr:hypothetical protein EVJ58_g521 [Rhodofomes roseus]
MTSRTDLLFLDDDVLWIIVSWLPHHAAAQLALTSRAVGTAARRRVLSSLQIAAPFASIQFHKFMLEEDDGYRLQCLRRLTINLSSLPPHELPDGYTPLADVLKRARNLQALVVPSLEQHLATRNGHVLGDAIAALHDLRELDLRSVGGKGLDLCKRLASKPDVLRFQALSTDTEPHTLIDRTMLSELNVLQRASTIILHEFTFVQSDHDRYQPLSPSPLPKSASLWPNAKTLRLKNMDPMPVVALCPNLASLYISAVNDGGPFYPDDVHNPYSTIDTLVPEVTTRLRVFDVSVNNDRSDLSETIDTIFRASYPRVLSIPYFWESLASVAKHPGSRLRYLDVLFHDHTDLAQDWLDEYLPMFSNCGILCIRIRLVEFIDDTITEQEWQSREDDDWDDWMVGSEWKELRDAIPNLVLKAVPSLRYVSVSPGYMVHDWNGLDEPAFVGQTRWWRATSGNSEAGLEDGQAAAELMEIDAGEGQRIDEYMRSEAFQEGSL